jgi:hypothetical protein
LAAAADRLASLYRLPGPVKVLAVGRLIASSALLTMLSFGPAKAGYTGAGQIAALEMLQGVTLDHFSGAVTGRSSCPASQRWAINVSTPTGQALLSGILTAFSSGQEFRYSGPASATFGATLRALPIL